MTDKVISMADFQRTKDEIEGREHNATHITIEYDELVFASDTLVHLAKTGEIVVSEMVDTYEIVANVLKTLLDEIGDDEDDDQDV